MGSCRKVGLLLGESRRKLAGPLHMREGQLAFLLHKRQLVLHKKRKALHMWAKLLHMLGPGGSHTPPPPPHMLVQQPVCMMVQVPDRRV